MKVMKMPAKMPKTLLVNIMMDLPGSPVIIVTGATAVKGHKCQRALGILSKILKAVTVRYDCTANSQEMRLKYQSLHC
jgi:hypothetical protein